VIKKIMVVLAICMGLFPQFSQAETEKTKQLAREATLAMRKASVASNMNLSENEEKAFWPIYNEYQIELNKLNADIEAIVMKFALNYKDVTEPLAKELMGRAIKAEQERLQLNKATCGAISDALGSKLAARFYQVENKIEALVKVETTSQVPLIK